MKRRINQIGDIGSGTHASAVTDATGKYGYDNQFYVYTPGNGSPPGIPDIFYGTIYINGSPAPAGTVITADMVNNTISFSVNGVSTGQTAQYEWGGRNNKDFYVTGSTPPVPPPTGSFVAGTNRNFSMALHNPASVAVTYTNLQLWLKRSDSVSVPDGWSTSLDQLVLSAGSNGTFSGSIRLPDNAGPYEARLRGRKTANGVTTDIEISIGQTVTVTAAVPTIQVNITGVTYIPNASGNPQGTLSFSVVNNYTGGVPFTHKVTVDGVLRTMVDPSVIPSVVTAYNYAVSSPGSAQFLPALAAGTHTVELSLYAGSQLVSNIFTGTITVTAATPPPPPPPPSSVKINITSVVWGPNGTGNPQGDMYFACTTNMTAGFTATMILTIDGTTYTSSYGIPAYFVGIQFSNYMTSLFPILSRGNHAVTLKVMEDSVQVSNTFQGTITVSY